MAAGQRMIKRWKTGWKIFALSSLTVNIGSLVILSFFAHREAVVEVEVVGRRYCYGQSEISMENRQSLL